VKTVDKLIQRLQQTERDTKSQLEKYKDEFNMKIEQEKKSSKEELTTTRNDLTLKLQQTENKCATKQELGITKDELRATKENLQTILKGELAEMKKSFADVLKELADTKADLKSSQEEARKIKDDLSQQLVVSKREAKKTKGKFIQKLTNTEKDLNTTKQQLATTCQNLIKAEKEHTTLAANTDEALAKLETKFQTKITKIETAAQKRITELETKMEHKTQQIKQLISDPNIYWYNTVNYQASSKLSSGDQVVPVVVKMSEYTKKKSGKVTWFSDSFYTHHKGYKMCSDVDAAGWCITGYVSVFLFLMKGPYDDQLRWPLKGHCEVKLLNQISNSEHHLGNGKYRGDGHKRVTSGERSSYYMWCSYQFISHEHLHKITPTCQYLKDDSIFLQVNYKLD